MLKPWESRGRAVALDSTTLQAKGGVWHKKDKKAGRYPIHLSTEAEWTKSGWHGWVYGWKLHLAICVCEVWIPLAARLTPANTADNLVAPTSSSSCQIGYASYSETSTTTPPTSGRHVCEAPRRRKRSGSWSPPNEGLTLTPMMALKSGASSTSCAAWLRNFNEHFKAIFELHGQVPTRGLINTARFALGAVLVYQLALLYRHERNLDINRGLKPFLRAA